MPRHNQVILYGQVYHESSLGYNTGDVNDPNRKLLRASNNLRVVRGFRDFGAVDKRLRVDAPLIATSNQALMAKMRLWRPGDMYLVKGNVITLNGNERYTCPLCGKDFLVPAVFTFVNPILIAPMETNLTWEEAVQKMVERKEISNIVTLFGKCSGEVRSFETEKGQLICNYTLDVPRKFYIKEDHTDTRHDYPIIKSYGNVARNDLYGVLDNGEIFVDGMLQTRTYKRTIECPECGESAIYDGHTTEVVAYSCEYGRGCRTMEEIQAIHEKEEDELTKAAFRKFGLDSMEDDE